MALKTMCRRQVHPLAGGHHRRPAGDLIAHTERRAVEVRLRRSHHVESGQQVERPETKRSQDETQWPIREWPILIRGAQEPCEICRRSDLQCPSDTFVVSGAAIISSERRVFPVRGRAIADHDQERLTRNCSDLGYRGGRASRTWVTAACSPTGTPAEPAIGLMPTSIALTGSR